jgi:hypothetical protein
MADLTGYKSILVGGAAQSVPLKLVDNSDGTYSEQVAIGSSALPTGAATAAKQDTGNTSLSSIDTKLSGTGAVKDNGPAWTSAHGIAGLPFTSADQHSAVASVTSAPTSGQKLVITDIFVSVDTAMSVTFKEETSGTVITGPFYLPANGTIQLTPRGKQWKLPVADKKLQVLTSVSGNIMVDAGYYSEA